MHAREELRSKPPRQVPVCNLTSTAAQKPAQPTWTCSSSIWPAVPLSSETDQIHRMHVATLRPLALACLSPGPECVAYELWMSIPQQRGRIECKYFTVPLVEPQLTPASVDSIRRLSDTRA